MVSRNTRIFILIGLALATVASSDPSSYRLGPEDVVTVNVLGHPEFSGDFLVPSDGSLTLPSIGTVRAAGMTLDGLAAEAATRLKERLINPEVTVALKIQRMQRIYVLGEVKNPGQFDVKPGWRIAEAIAAAGGLTSETEPSDCQVIILRGSTGLKETRNFGDVIRGDSEANLPVESGDLLTVDSGETFPVYVMGKVKNPGLYKARKAEAGVLEALALAGGTTEGAGIGTIRVTHLSGESEMVDLSSALVGGHEVSTPRLQAGDLVLVPETTARIAVLGFVTQPGFYTLRDGEKLTLTDALGLAKGLDNKRGEKGSIAIIRSENGRQQRLAFDLNRFLKKGDASQNPEIRPGDVIYVAETRKLDWGIVLQSVSTVGILVNPFIR